MKTKLTTLKEEFEKFRRETEKRIWSLENPERFKFGDKVKVKYSFMDGSCEFEGIYKGVSSVVNNSRHCYVEAANKIFDYDECWLLPVKDGDALS